MTTSIRRSDALLLAGYFLARCTETGKRGTPVPPACLSVTTWGAAYDLFHRACGDGRTPGGFRNSLRNTRDAFDALFDNGRRGWVDDTGEPLFVDERCRTLHDYWRQRSDDDLRSHVLAQLVH